MAGVYRPRHPDRTVLYRVLFHYFDRFLAEYEGRFEKEYGFFRPIIKEVVERYLDCGNPRCGFARTRGFCPSCHSKRLEEWGEWMQEELLLDVPHRQVVFTIPRMLRIFFKYNRRLLGSLCRCALRSLTRYFEVTTGSELMPGVIAAIQTFGGRIIYFPTRSASFFVLARTRLWTLKPVCLQESKRSAHSGLRSSLRTRSARTSRAKSEASRASSASAWKSGISGA